MVDDCLSGLQRLAATHMRGLDRLTVIGITGSNGKTTTKEILGRILDGHGATVVNPGNFNSEIGLPLSVFAIRDTHRYAVLEMGMNRKGEMDILTEIARPQISAITNIGVAHIGLVGSQQAIAVEKRKIFTFVGADGVAFLREEEPFADFLIEGCRGEVVFFGPGATPGYEGVDDAGLDGSIIRWKGHRIRFPLIGPYNLINALCAVSIAVKLGASDAAVIEGLEKVEPLFGRGEVLVGEVTLIQDCYNANTDSMKKAIDFIGSLPWTGRKILILGSMKELGAESDNEHRAIGRYAADSDVDIVLFYGDESVAAYDAAIGVIQGGKTKRIEWTNDFDELDRAAGMYVNGGDIVLLKGSRGVELERLSKRLLDRAY